MTLGIGYQPGRLRWPGSRRLLPRRDHREARTPAVQHHARRVHDMRAAHASMGGHQQERVHQPRRLRLRAQHGAEGQGRAGVLPAGHLLPDPGRQPRHGLPAADLRHVHPARPGDNQRLLLGDQPQPGRDAHPRLVHAVGPGRRAASIATSPAIGRRATSGCMGSRGTKPRSRRTASRAPCRPTTASRSPATANQSHRQPPARPRLRGLLLRHRHAAALPARTSTRPRRAAGPSRAASAARSASPRRALTYQRNEYLQGTASSTVYGSTPRISVGRGPADALRHAHLRLGEHRIRPHPRRAAQRRRGDVRQDAEPGGPGADAADAALAADVSLREHHGELPDHLLLPVARRGRRPDGCGADAPVPVAAVRIHRPRADQDLGHARRGRPPSG